MPNSSQAEVEKNLLKARIALSLRQPFLASAIMRLPIKNATSTTWCRTMSTDGYHIFFNAEWVSTLSQAEIRGVLAHEVLHVLFQHSSRRANRDPELWNIAADHAINLLLIDQSFSLPKDGFASNAYKGLSAEQIYALLPQTVSYERGDKKGINRRAESQEEGGLIPSIGADVLDPDRADLMGLRDPDMPDHAQLNELCAELRRDAVCKLQGDAAASFSAECSAIDEAKIDWREQLRCWLIDRVKSDWSMWPCSKKHLHRGLYLPSLGVQAPGHIVFAVDTSGSMTDQDLADIFSEIRIYRETFPSRLTVIQCDAALHSVTTFEELDGEEVPKSITIHGRGGTDFRPVFQWIDDNAVGAHLIYATDGMGTFPANEQTGGVIWLVPKGGAEKSTFPFGVCIDI